MTNRTSKALVVLFVLVCIGWFGYKEFDRWHNRVVDQSLLTEQAKYLPEIVRLKAEVDRLKSELSAKQEQDPQPDKSELTNAFGAEEPLAAMAMNAMDCKQINSQVVAFFNYLDRKTELFGPGAGKNSEVFFEDISKDLNAKPPINVGEMDSTFRLIGNVTHFYRVLGRDRILLIKKILKEESAVVEPAMAVLFAWQTICSNGLNQSNLEALYPYACFLLNTLGGRSYMLRRDGRIRTLLNYYALLTLDMANDAKRNSFGIDIRPHLEYLLFEINNQKGLVYRQQYLSRINGLISKYQ